MAFAAARHAISVQTGLTHVTIPIAIAIRLLAPTLHAAFLPVAIVIRAAAFLSTGVAKPLQTSFRVLALASAGTGAVLTGGILAKLTALTVRVGAAMERIAKVTAPLLTVLAGGTLSVGATNPGPAGIAQAVQAQGLAAGTAVFVRVAVLWYAVVAVRAFLPLETLRIGTTFDLGTIRDALAEVF